MTLFGAKLLVRVLKHSTKAKKSEHNIPQHPPWMLIAAPLPTNNPNVNLSIFLPGMISPVTSRGIAKKMMGSDNKWCVTSGCSDVFWEQDAWITSGHDDTPHYPPFVCRSLMNSSNINTKYYRGGVQCQVWSLGAHVQCLLVFRTNNAQTKNFDCWIGDSLENWF